MAEVRRTRRWRLGGLVLAVLAAVTATGSAPVVAGSATDEYETTRSYVETFYPLFMTNTQFTLAPTNKLIGPDKISPVYQAVVAINDDTLYANAPLDLAAEPVILTVPQTTVSYSSLVLDAFGQVYDVGLPSQSGGTVLPESVWALTGPGWSGSLPGGVTQIAMPLDRMAVIFRSDRFTPEGQEVTGLSETFRTSLKLQTLTNYIADPTAGATQIKPAIEFGGPFKTVADLRAQGTPIVFLTELQKAVHGMFTPPLTPAEQDLSDAFDSIFPPSGDDDPFKEATRDAHQAIIDNYLSSRGPTGWIHFTNIGKWGDAVLDRSSLNEYIQFGNSIETAAYYHTFVDGDGNPLVGSNPDGYVLTFPAELIPPAGRFWSVTAYTPHAIELIPNPLDKYLVGSYTPGLKKNTDGSVSIYVSQQQPRGVPQANWLPVHSDAFNLMLRVYGVVGGSSVANDTYVPPAVDKFVPSPTFTG